MLLTVSKKVGMWGFGPLWFTFVDPKPQNINLEELDELTREKVNTAIAQGVLIQIDKVGKPVDTVPTKQIQGVQRPIVDEADAELPQVSPVIARKLTELLKNGVTTLRKEIPLIKSHQMLSAALKFEKQGKDRKTVKELLEKEIVKTGNVKKMYDDLIVEEEIETITFKVEDMILKSEEQYVQVEDGLDGNGSSQNKEIMAKNLKKKVKES